MEIQITEKPVVMTREDIAMELMEDAPTDASSSAPATNPELVSQANDIVSRIMSVGPDDLANREKFVKAIQDIGKPVQAELARQSQLLRAPMKTLIKDAEDGGEVANNLLSLQEKVNEINPNRIDFSMGTVRRLLAMIPGVGTPLARWFARYQAVNSVIDDIVRSLKSGRARLERDNTTLRDDQQRMRKLTFRLQDYVTLAQLLDQKLQDAVNSGKMDPDRQQFVEEELLFPLRQRIIDLQQQLAVNQQGVLATEVIIRNNRELITGVDRALNVTITALNTAATLQVALQHQKKVLDGVEAVNSTTNDLIASTAEQLKTQGAEIQKRAASSQLDIDTLKKAFSDVDTALRDISEFRRNALPQMAQSILEMDDICNKMEGSIARMEQGNVASNDLELDLINLER